MRAPQHKSLAPLLGAIASLAAVGACGGWWALGCAVIAAWLFGAAVARSEQASWTSVVHQSSVELAALRRERNGLLHQLHARRGGPAHSELN